MTAARALPAALAAVALLAVAGCTVESEALPPGNDVIGGDAWFFEAVRTFCDHGHRVYHVAGQGYGGGIAVVPADPSCAGGAR